jgi:hypothetical protein
MPVDPALRPIPSLPPSSVRLRPKLHPHPRQHLCIRTHLLARPLTNPLPLRAPATFAKYRSTRDRQLIRQPLLEQPLSQPRRLSRPQRFSQELRYHPEQDVAQPLPRRFRLSICSSYKQRGQWPDRRYFCKYRSVYSCHKQMPLGMHLPGRPLVLCDVQRIRCLLQTPFLRFERQQEITHLAIYTHEKKAHHGDGALPAVSRLIC